jgi:hypothetical protein
MRNNYEYIDPDYTDPKTGVLRNLAGITVDSGTDAKRKIATPTTSAVFPRKKSFLTSIY